MFFSSANSSGLIAFLYNFEHNACYFHNDLILMKYIPGTKIFLEVELNWAISNFYFFQFHSKQKKCYTFQIEVPSGYCKNRISLLIQNKPPSNISIFIQSNCVSVYKIIQKIEKIWKIYLKHTKLKNTTKMKILDKGCGRKLIQLNNAPEKYITNQEWASVIALFSCVFDVIV